MSTYLSFDHVDAGYGAVKILKDLSFQVEEGSILGVIGPNGCGKTTLLDIFAGILAADEGSFSRQGKAGYVMQSDGFQEQLSCRDNLLFEAAMLGLTGAAAGRRVEECATLCGVQTYWDKRLGKCSAGMRARVGFAAAFLGEPKVLLLDEAFGSLDEETAAAFHALLAYEKARGLALVIVSHAPEDFAGLCERVLTLPGSAVSPL